MIETVGLFLLLLALSAFFSGSEIAFFSIPPARARALEEEGRRGAAALVELRSAPDRLLVLILVGNNVANVGAASLATYLATRALGSAGVGVATGVVTLLLLVFGEITPKSFASANAVRIALFAAPFLHLLGRVLFFVVEPFTRFTRALMPRASRRGGYGITEGEIRKLTQMGHLSGAIEEHERELIERAFLLDSTQVWEVMVPRVDIFAWPAARRLSEVAGELSTVPFSRIPVYGESLDDIVGILYLRDAFQSLVRGEVDRTLGELAREPFFVPESLTLIELLSQFQARRMHQCVVVDEHGGTDGLVTLEDVLEELVGEIVDEVDVPEETLTRVHQNEALIEGSADLREVNRHFQCDLPTAEHRTLNGFLLEELGRVPEPGEILQRDDLLIEVLAATDTQVTRVRFTRCPAGGPGDGKGSPEGARTGPPDEAGRGLVVVGGGLAGACVALEARSRGAEVLVLERERVGARATGASAGMLAPQYEAAAASALFRFAVEARREQPAFLARIRRLAGGGPELRRTGMLVACFTEEELERERASAARQVAAGLRAEIVPPDRAERLQPGVTQRAAAFLWLPEEARVDTQRLAAVLPSALSAAGVRVREGVEVRAIEAPGGRVRSVLLADGERMEAEEVVLAAGAWCARIHGLPEPVPVRPVRGQLLRFGPGAASLNRLLADPEGHYLVPRRDGSLLAGSTMEEAGFDGTTTPEGREEVRRSAARLLPVLEGAREIASWAGLRPVSADGLPLLGPDPAVRGLHWATGYGRNGILLAPLAARAAVDLAFTGTTDVPWRPFRPDRFRE